MSRKIEMRLIAEVSDDCTPDNVRDAFNLMLEQALDSFKGELGTVVELELVPESVEKTGEETFVPASPECPEPAVPESSEEKEEEGGPNEVTLTPSFGVPGAGPSIRVHAPHPDNPLLAWTMEISQEPGGVRAILMPTYCGGLMGEPDDNDFDDELFGYWADLADAADAVVDED